MKESTHIAIEAYLDHITVYTVAVWISPTPNLVLEVE